MADSPIKTLGQATKLTFPDGQELLVVTIQIDCPACGHLELHLHGHHVVAVQKLLADFAAEFPDLVGREEDLEVVNRLSFGGEIPPDPRNN